MFVKIWQRFHAMHESPPFATPDAKSCFCFPSLWQSKRKKPNFFAKNDSGKTLAEVTEKTLQDQRGRRENLERITREYGTQLRMNRSIQAEGSFADVKADMAFRRYTYRGIDNVTAQSVVLAIAHNINKLHNKIQNDKTGRHLFELKKTA